jgi:hypothetical protein
MQVQIREKEEARNLSAETEFLRERERSRELNVGTLSCRIKAGQPRHRHDENRPSVAVDLDPPIALDKFIEQSGLSVVTVWRYRRTGWLQTLNICGRHYLTRSEIGRFNARAAAGEFAKAPTKPKRRRRCKPFG